MASYLTERDGQIDFYNTFLPRINPNLTVDDVLSDSNDGVLNGNLLEFKKDIKDINAALFQGIKYLSALRIKGKPVPATIHIVDVNAEIDWVYESVPFLSEIETVYTGGASKGTSGFVGGKAKIKLEYNKNVADADNLVRILKEDNYTKINIDENCIVGWAENFYKQIPGARKEDFIGDDTGKHNVIGEIRNPSHFKDYIYPYTGESNIKFGYLMDKLNESIKKKNLGAFYTPTPYAEKSHELLRMAINRVPAGNDYVIIDRCAGTGNLEETLSDEELSHVIVSTIEYYEYKVLLERLGAKVRAIIPPIEASDTFIAATGLVKGSDALSKEFIENPIVKAYIDDPKCTIILFENPPYAETTSAEHQRKGKSKSSSSWKESFVATEMKRDASVKGSASNDLGNAFIWSGFKYYLRQPTDSYIVYSPVKYWKAQHIVNKVFIRGFAFNRKWFHTTIEACIMVALWSNENDFSTEEIVIEGFNYNADSNSLDSVGLLPVKRIHESVSKTYYDKRPIPPHERVGVLCALNGLEKTGGVRRNKPAYSNEIIGYMVTHSSGFDNPDLDSSLLVGGRYDGNGFYLHKDNYLEKMPLFCMSRYITYNRAWTERARIMKSGDGVAKYNADVGSGKLDPWLRKCLLFTCLEMQNHMRTFMGSDGRFYRNELCLDTTNGGTVASLDIKKLKMNADERKLIKQWEDLLDAAKATKQYNNNLTYGVYQIYDEIDVSHKDPKTNDIVYDNPEVHSALQTLKALVKEYYNKEIVPTLFEYEFLK